MSAEWLPVRKERKKAAPAAQAEEEDEEEAAEEDEDEEETELLPEVLETDTKGKMDHWLRAFVFLSRGAKLLATAMLCAAAARCAGPASAPVGVGAGVAAAISDGVGVVGCRRRLCPPP